MADCKDKCDLHLYLGKKDLEILKWKDSLPPRCFKYYLEQILLSYITGQKVMIPPIQDIPSELRVCPIHMVITNKQIVEFLSQFEKGEKSRSVKNILIYYIRESKNGQYISKGKKNKKSELPIYNIPVDKTRKENKPSLNKNENDFKKSTQSTTPPSSTVHKENSTNKTKSVVQERNHEEPKQTPKNPMMQALFKMSGDE